MIGGIAMAKQRPGVMIYFDLRNSIKRLNEGQIGKLFTAILDYGEMGIIPDFDNDMALAITWDFIQPRIDKDGERFEQKVEQRKYAAYCKKQKEVGKKPLEFDEWMASKDNDRERPLSTDDECNPPTSTTASTPTSTATASSTSQLQPHLQTQPQPQPCMREPCGSDPPSGIRLLEEPGTDFEKRRREQMAKLLGGGP